MSGPRRRVAMVAAALGGALALGLTATVAHEESAPTFQQPDPVQPDYPGGLGITPQAAPCSATTPQGTTYDPCALNPGDWIAAFWNPLQGSTYFQSWKRSAPVDYAAMEAWRKDGLPYSSSPGPTARTPFGAVVRYGIASCKAWVDNPVSCGG